MQGHPHICGLDVVALQVLQTHRQEGGIGATGGDITTPQKTYKSWTDTPLDQTTLPFSFVKWCGVSVSADAEKEAADAAIGSGNA